MSRGPLTPSAPRRRVSFSTVLNFQSPPAHRSPRRPRTPLSGNKHTRPRHHGSKHHKHHHHHHHNHSRDDLTDKALVVYAGSTPGKPCRARVLREARENLPCADDFKLPPKKPRECSRDRRCRHHRVNRGLELEDKENVPTMIGPKPYNVAAQNKYAAELRQLALQAEQRAAARAGQPNFFPALELAAEGSFYPSLDAAGRGVLVPRAEPEPSPLERILFLEENGAKAHMHRFVFSHLHLSLEEGLAGMLHALDGSQLHALYVLARGSPCGLALLRRAEAEEREVARLHVAARKGLGKYAVARVIADERRFRRAARLGLRMFFENEGGVWTEGNGVENAVRALGQRIERLRGFQVVGAPEMERVYAHAQRVALSEY